MELHLITYNKGEFDPNKFQPIKNRYWNKPSGGLWASPINAKYGWKEWCRDEHFCKCDIEKSFQLLFNGNALVIDSFEDLDKMPWIKFEDLEESQRAVFNRFHLPDFPNFELMVKHGIDAIYLTDKGERDTRHSQPRNLYGWDCESVIIFNKATLTPIKEPLLCLPISNHDSLCHPFPTGSDEYSKPIYDTPVYSA